MKNIKPTWFIEHPIDQEHKQYLLLDFLSSVNKDIEKEDIYLPIKKIFSMIKELSLAKTYIENRANLNEEITSANLRDILKKLEHSDLDQNDKQELTKVVDGSLSILYKYADLGMDLWKNIESRIRTFQLKGRTSEENHGILLCRNMANDMIVAYWWKIGETREGSKGALMKKVSLRNPYFSLSYEFVAHEVLDQVGVPAGFDPPITIMEIFEDFDQESVTLKIAKELFVREISSKTEKDQ